MSSMTVSKEALLSALEARYDHQSARTVMAMTLAMPGLEAGGGGLDLTAVNAALEAHVEYGLSTIREQLDRVAMPGRPVEASSKSGGATRAKKRGGGKDKK